MKVFNWGPLGMRESPREPHGVRQFCYADDTEELVAALALIADGYVDRLSAAAPQSVSMSDAMQTIARAALAKVQRP